MYWNALINFCKKFFLVTGGRGIGRAVHWTQKLFLHNMHFLDFYFFLFLKGIFCSTSFWQKFKKLQQVNEKSTQLRLLILLLAFFKKNFFQQAKVLSTPKVLVLGKVPSTPKKIKFKNVMYINIFELIKNIFW
jgi:hypothetical protein